MQLSGTAPLPLLSLQPWSHPRLTDLLSLPGSPHPDSLQARTSSGCQFLLFVQLVDYKRNKHHFIHWETKTYDVLLVIRSLLAGFRNPNLHLWQVCCAVLLAYTLCLTLKLWTETLKASVHALQACMAAMPPGIFPTQIVTQVSTLQQGLYQSRTTSGNLNTGGHLSLLQIDLPDPGIKSRSQCMRPIYQLNYQEAL